MAARDHIDKVGIIGATIAALCCLGVPAILSVAAALGVGFLIKDVVLAPLLILSLALVVWGLVRGHRWHRNWLPVIVGVLASVALVAASLVWPFRPIAYASIGALVLASIANVVLLHRRHSIA